MLRGFSVRGGSSGGDDSGGERSRFERRGDGGGGGGDREMREVKASAALRRLALDGENEEANNDGDDGGDPEGIDEEISEIVSFGGGRTGSNGSGSGGGAGGGGGGGGGSSAGGAGSGGGGSGGDAAGSTEVFVVTTDTFFAAQAASIDAAVAAVDDDDDDDDGMIAGVGSSTSLGSGGLGAAGAAAAAGSDHGAGADANSPYDATRVINGIDLTKFFRWVTCICVVTFDLELGQAIESVYPPTELTDQEKANISYSAFADSNSSAVGDVTYTFRIPKPAPTTARPDPANLQVRRPGFSYGYVLFRQRRDESIKRGYFQKSVVLVSVHPFVGLFREVVRILAPAFFTMGLPILETACQTIASWPAPRLGRTYELPFMGSVLHVTLPMQHGSQWDDTYVLQTPTDMGVANDLLVPVRATSAYECFKEVIPHLWTLWELTTLAEPTIVMATSPHTGSEAVLSLVSLISPIPYNGDFRPYFTIHDPDFKAFVNKARAPASVILGVTNPFFVKALEHWPHTLRVGQDVRAHTAANRNNKSSLEFVPGLKTAYKPLLSPDKALIKQLQVADPAQEHTASALLSRYFADLTQSFLLPFERYLSGLTPVVRDVSAWKMPPRVRPFKTEDFAGVLRTNAIPLHDRFGKRKSDWIEFYLRFIRTPNFLAWLRSRVRQIERQLRRVYLEALQEADVATWMKDKHEIRRVDFMLRVQEELRLPGSVAALGAAGVKRLQAHVEIIVRGLPDDLRRSLEAQAQAQAQATQEAAAS